MGVFGLFSDKAATKANLIAPEAALPGRPNPIATAERHVVLGTALKAPLSTSQQEALFGCGCFWGAEKGFWRLPGVVTTAVGYGSTSDRVAHFGMGPDARAVEIEIQWPGGAKQILRDVAVNRVLDVEQR